MARMIDPSELEGDELANWYRRSPADVEAQREAARQEQYDKFVKSIGAPSESQDHSDEDGRERSADAGDDSFDHGDTGLIKARFPQPSASPMMMTPPSGLRVGPPVDAQAGPPTGAARSGFFGSQYYSSSLGGYFTDMPVPLNTVTSPVPGWWEIGDGRRVRTDEVERIYAEQQRRLRGQDDVAPAARIRVVDRRTDGQIPLASQVANDERELDPTCAPNGGWERDPGFSNYPELSKRYEAQITRAPGLDYVVRNPGQGAVRFDGCAVWDPRHPLLEAKGPGYEALLPKAQRYQFYGKMFEKAQDQAGRQAAAAGAHPIEWHVAEQGAFPYFESATDMLSPPIAPKLTPAR